jgi:hypothetical protein
MVRFSINDISKRTEIATAMQARCIPRHHQLGPEGAIPIAEVTAFFLRDPAPGSGRGGDQQQDRQSSRSDERHRVEVARLQSDQQRLLNQTLTAEALTKQYLEVLHDMKQSSNLIVLVPTEGGVPMLDLSRLKQNLRGP